MDRQRKRTMDLKNLFMCSKLIVLIVLLVFYYQFFFIEVFENYKAGLTNMATMQEEVPGWQEGMNLPAISICLSPQRKPLKMRELNLTESFFVMLTGSYEHLDNDLIMEDIIEETSFKLNEDFHIELGEFWSSNVTFWNQPLHLGQNSFPQYEVQLKEYYSMHKGKCYLLTSNAKVTGGTPISLAVILNKSAIERPEQVNLFITSQPNYLGTLIGNWKSLKPLTTTVNFEEGNQAIELKESYTQLISNCDSSVDSFYQCIRQGYLDILLKASKCSKCVPMLAKSFVDTDLYPACPTLSDERCNVDCFAKDMPNIIRNCKIQCQIEEYTGEFSKNSIEVNEYGNRSADIMISSSADLRTVTREYWVYDAAGLVGNVGGSLGLFIGFSFFGFFSDFLDFLRNKLTR